MWIFDLPDDGGRLLRPREGHSDPPTKVRFYGVNGKNILSAGRDSTLRSFSTEADNLNKSLAQASFNRKAAKRKGVKHDTKEMLPILDLCSAHDGSVRGVAIDGFNQMVTSGDSDKLLKFWRFKDHGKIATIELEQSVSKMILHRERKKERLRPPEQSGEDNPEVQLVEDFREAIRVHEDSTPVLEFVGFIINLEARP
ncbi:WD repeat-containing protein 36 [Araneus ventricosus]|uniref:WD repeat-containing protein 36 n=1 Tax=Araneus ventricosus TaxID=182803 RepID=A0A4Y2FFW0_ARAVE|nr:WD repeat-containing protein 36 [Araneus ventricosus]